MTGQKTATAPYKFLYRFLSVLDENQIHKLHKIVSGILDINAFSADEIKHLESRLSTIAINRSYMPANDN